VREFITLPVGKKNGQKHKGPISTWKGRREKSRKKGHTYGKQVKKGTCQHLKTFAQWHLSQKGHSNSPQQDRRRQGRKRLGCVTE